MVDIKWKIIIKEHLMADYSGDVLGRRNWTKKLRSLGVLTKTESCLFRKKFERLEAELIGKSEPEIAAILKQWQQEINELKEGL